MVDISGVQGTSRPALGDVGESPSPLEMVDAPGGSDDDVAGSVGGETGHMIVREGGRVGFVMGKGGELAGLDIEAEQAVLRPDPKVISMDHHGGDITDTVKFREGSCGN